MRNAARKVLRSFWLLFETAAALCAIARASQGVIGTDFGQRAVAPAMAGAGLFGSAFRKGIIGERGNVHGLVAQISAEI